MKKSTLLFALFTALILGGMCVPAFAASPSPSPRTSPSPSPVATTDEDATSSAVQQNIKDRIEQVIEEKKTTGDTRRKRAIVGQVEKLNAESITIRTLDGRVQIAKLMDGKTIMLLMPGLSNLQTQDIELNSFVIAMGYLTEDEVLEVRRLLVSPTPLFPIARQILVGKIKSITTKDVTLTSAENEDFTVLVSKNTKYEDENGEKATRIDFKKDDKIFVSVPSPLTASSSAGLVRLLQ